jgi:hypothetical protein
MRKHTRQLPSERQQQMMKAARWMVDFQNHYGQNNDNRIVFHLKKSSALAAGPALRLANAVWDLEYRLRFPKRKKLIVQEEDSFAHLRSAHKDVEKAKRYHVWQAIELFVDIRMQAIPEQPLAVLQPPRFEARDDTLKKALFCLDYWASPSNAAPYVRQTLVDFVTLPPHMAPHMLAVAKAMWELESWRSNSRESERFKRFLKAYNQMLNHIYKNQWLWETKVGDAANLLQAEYHSHIHGGAR